ncbi:MAG: hypothetical protein Q8T04_20530 [Bacteroidota bacterium]|nr:hypothetical protein [Bacteroidota bacterium]
MTTLQLKKALINRINEIDDVSFLSEIKRMIDSNSKQQILKLTPEQRQEINDSKKEICDGNFSEQSEIDKDVAKWANEK